jgi:hypothetical protein
MLMRGLPTLFEPGLRISLTGGATTVGSSVSPTTVGSEVSSPPGSSGTGPRSGPPESIVVLEEGGGVVGGELVGGVVLGGAVVVRPPPGGGVGRDGSASQAIPSLSASKSEGSVWSLSYHAWASS